MENYVTFIGLIAAILGLVAVIMKLIVTNKQIRRENTLEKKMLEEENLKKIEHLNKEKKEKESQSEILQISINVISDYLENELPKRLKDYATAKQLKVLDKDIKLYISNQLNLLDNAKTENTLSKKKRVEKTIAEAFGIEISDHTIEASGYETFFTDRVERRIKKHMQEQSKRL
ncbi:hypothetical protein GCM10022291_12630 [Postechiella marina]|uniref:Uncharacterized protein n=1 Tax=Postechiella marina TaxID=943941 RepID=A0ABP8C5R5_9FLAO